MRLNFTFNSFLFLFVFLFSTIEGFSQTTGDYRSSGTGNWTALASWQYYNGTTWATPTSGQGYPGQYTGTGAVFIQAGHTITIGNSGITTQTMGSLTVNGTLYLDGTNASGGIDYNINVGTLTVTEGLSPVANIYFDQKVNFKLPANTPISVGADGLKGDCSHNQEIYIGSMVIAYCSGGGTTFSEIMANGGYYVVSVSPESDSSCGTKTFSFTATAFPASGSTIKWYTTSSGGTAFRTNTSGTDTFSSSLSTTTNYYVEVSYSNGYTTPRKVVTALVTNTAAPTGAASQSFCSGSGSTVASLSATGTGIKWYAASSGGTALATNTVLTNGTHYYATQTVGGCESSSRFDVIAEIISAPSTPGTITGSVTQCAGNTSQVYSISPVANATSYNWTLPTNWSITSGAGTNSITVSIPSNGVTGNVSVNATNSCGTSGSVYQWVAVSIPTVAGTVTPANTIVCSGSNSTNLSLGGNTGNILRWESSLDNFAGGTITAISNTGSPITASNLTVDTYYRAVVQNGGCNVLYSNSVKITVLGSTATPGAITGSVTQCAGNTSQVYSVSPVANATNYTWTVDTGSGWVITSGQGTNSITVTVGTGSANVSVNANNSCSVGYGPYQWVAVSAASSGGTLPANVSGCANSYIANIGLSGYLGAPIRWESSIDNFATTPTVIATTANNINISNLAQTTYYRAVVQNSPCVAISYSSVCMATVNANSVSTASSSPSLCIGTTMTNITHTTTGATGIGWAANLPAGVSASWTSNTITISGTPTASGTFNYSIPLTGGCDAVNATGTITVTSLSTPTAGTPTNPTCKVPTGSVPLSSLPSSGSIIQTGNRNDSYTITGGGTQIITGLLPGTYYFSVENGSCTSASVSVTIIAPVTNTWSTGSWSDGTPTINQRLVFSSNYTNANDVDLEGCSCQVAGSAVVTIKSGRTLKIENGVDVQPNASLIFENNASLVQINDDPTINSGNITYHRYTAAVKRYDFTYWSSPVAGQILKALSPNTLFDKYYSYDNGWKISYYGTATMVAGRGYLIRAPQTFSITAASVDTNPTFIGKPNNGVVEKAVESDKIYLLGNPYPSAIDADKFIAANSTSLEGTLYFWTHNTSPSKDIAGNALYNYTTNDYVTYNKTGGVNLATGKIAAGQGFFAQASATGGTLVFNNAMRLGTAGAVLDNSQFYKLSSTSKITTTTVTAEKSRIWLNFTNKEGAYKQMLIGYITGATNDYDRGFDGVTYDGNQYVDFYSVNNAVNLSIQGRALPFVKQDSVALGYKSAIAGDFQISIDHADGVLETQNIFLEDKTLNVLHDLRKGSYSFTTVKGVFNDRFVLRYVDKNAVEEVADSVVSEELSNEVVASVRDGVITVSSTVAALKTVIIYNVSGGIVYQQDTVNADELVIPQLISSHQVLVVAIVLSDGTTLNRKIIY